MRYLLHDDEVRYSELKKEIQDRFHEREPQLDKKYFLFNNKFDVRDLEIEVLMNKLRGKESTLESLIKHKVDTFKEEYISGEIEIYLDDSHMYRSKGKAYPVQQWFLSLIRELKYLDNLKGKASKYLVDISEITDCDFRRFYIKDGGVYYGDVKRNEIDARLMGEISGGKLIITEVEYDGVLLNLKS